MVSVVVVITWLCSVSGPQVVGRGVSAGERQSEKQTEENIERQECVWRVRPVREQRALRAQEKQLEIIHPSALNLVIFMTNLVY